MIHVPGTWVLTSRWVYESLEMFEGIDLGRLLRIEFAFDVALIVGAAAMAWAFVTISCGQRHP